MQNINHRQLLQWKQLIYVFYNIKITENSVVKSRGIGTYDNSTMASF